METCRRAECPKTLPDAHGNSKYCSEICKELSRKIRQKHHYEFIKDIKNRLLLNCKVFEKWLQGRDSIKLNYHEALQQGFDQNAYYGRSKNAEDTYYHLNSYIFWFTAEGKVNYLNLKRTK